MHVQQAHTGDVRVVLGAETLSELFAEAGRALAEILVDGAGDAPLVWRHIRLEASDTAALLVRFLDELIYLTETTGFVFSSFAIDEATERCLSARIGGAPPRRWKTAVKAATWHGLSVTRDGGWHATVVLDV